ncbi:MAG: alpha/beta hydrolase [Pseudobdellovibrio sp.]|nr:alpha/beta hydrolase [Pseudobdellovibrio sp.]
MAKTFTKASLLSAVLFLFIFSCSSLPQKEVFSENTKGSVTNPKEVMFIHGMFMNSDNWTAWEKYFALHGYKTSSPAWPQHDKSVAEMRDKKNFDALAEVTLEDVLNHYRAILRDRPVKPILIGHSMGGLVSQILLSENLASAAVVLDSAPPRWTFVVSWSFTRTNWPVLNPFGSNPIVQDQDSFNYAFCNAQPKAEQKRIFETFAVPESKRVGRGPLTKAGSVNYDNARGPLLLVAGSEDHIIPAKLTYANFQKYDDTPGYTEFYLAQGRDHCLGLSRGWEELAEMSRNWLETHMVK